ncbi:MAG: 50S ribosomal protein L11 methyltransferase [Lentisphaeria bacterium]
MPSDFTKNDGVDVLWVVEFDLAPGQRGLIEEILSAHGQEYALWENRESGQSMVRIYCEDEQTAAQTDERVHQWLISWSAPALEPLPEIKRYTLLNENWTESWKQYFSVSKVSSRLVIKPSWEEYQPVGDDIVLEIDPGMSFGTGQHGTTRACLQFMDELSEKLGAVSLLDAGCGSGILSLAASKLGFAPIFAFDHDPGAVAVTREHLEPFAVEHPVHLTCSEIEAYTPPQPCRVVVANILAVVLLKHAEKIASFVDNSRKQPGYLILSGILEDQYAEIYERFTKLGFVEVMTNQLDEWKSGCFRLGDLSHDKQQ